MKCIEKVIVLFLALLLLACSENESNTLREMKSDKLFSESFSENELENLAKIVDFFESQICLDKSKSKEQCYFVFNQKIGKEFFKEELEFSQLFDYEKQQKLYKNIDTVFFKEIWVKRMSAFGNEDFKLSKHYDLKINGKYAEFLKKFCGENLFYEGYYKRLNITGEVHYRHFIDGFKNLKLEDLKDVKVRLLSAVHYLTNFEVSQFPYKREKNQ